MDSKIKIKIKLQKWGRQLCLPSLKKKSAMRLLENTLAEEILSKM